MKTTRLPLHALCPYFAMFPEHFVRKHVQAFSRKGDWVFDPFCGRGTTVLEALLLGRQAAGSDINPVAYCVSRAKAQRPSLADTLTRIERLEKRCQCANTIRLEARRRALPRFFRRAFYPSTLRQLLFLRSMLEWRSDKTDRFLAALIIGSLHGEMDRSKAYFSNQMPRTICLKPAYSLRYWNEHRLFPKKREVFGMLREKSIFRLNGIGRCPRGRVQLSDARAAANCFRSLRGQVSLVVTSPPYLNVTRYEEDQWLRLWFLGGAPRPTYGKVSLDDRHETEARYWRFLEESWAGFAPLLKKSARIVIRLGAIGLGQDGMTKELNASLKKVFPNARLIKSPSRSAIIGRQSENFAPKSKGCLFEMDYVFGV